MARHIGGERYRMPEIVADNFQVGVIAHQLVLIIAAAASVFEKDREEVTAVFAGIPFDDHPHARSDTDLYPHSGLLPVVDDILSHDIVACEMCQINERHAASHKAEKEIVERPAQSGACRGVHLRQFADRLRGKRAFDGDLPAQPQVCEWRFFGYLKQSRPACPVVEGAKTPDIAVDGIDRQPFVAQRLGKIVHKRHRHPAESQRAALGKPVQPVYSLNLVNEVFEPTLEGYYHHYAMVHIEHTDYIIDGLQLIFVELPKFTPHTYSEKRMHVLWLRFLTEIKESTRVVPKELLETPEITKALTVLEESAFTDEELAGYEHFWDGISVERTLYNSAIREGRAEGQCTGLPIDEIEHL